MKYFAISLLLFAIVAVAKPQSQLDQRNMLVFRVWCDTAIKYHIASSDDYLLRIPYHKDGPNKVAINLFMAALAKGSAYHIQECP